MLGAKSQATLPLYEEAIRLNPTFWIGYNNAMSTDWDLGDEEAAKTLGDVPARQRRWRDARVKYDQALNYAPAWTALRQARDLAMQRA